MRSIGLKKKKRIPLAQDPNETKRVKAHVYGGGGVLLFSLTEPVIPNTKQITAKEGCLTDS